MRLAELAIDIGPSLGWLLFGLACFGWWRASAAAKVHAADVSLLTGTIDGLREKMRERRAAFTLIELLIVVTIMLILVAAAATTLRPANDSRRIREAARAVNLYLASARNRAMETQRPCGVIIRRFSAALPCAMELDQCEVPIPYAGDIENSRATVSCLGTTLNITLDAADYPKNLLRSGDLIQFNYQGPLFEITNANDADGFIPAPVSGPFVLTADTKGQLVPWNGQTAAYRIFRSPSKSAAQSLQLPTAAVVDLTASGIDVGATFDPPPPTGDVILLFSSSGSIETVFVAGVRYTPVEPIFLLVGKRERMDNTFVAANPNETTLTNYQDLTNLWVKVNPQTGLVSSEVVGANVAIVDIASSRELARESVGVGGG